MRCMRATPSAGWGAWAPVESPDGTSQSEDWTDRPSRGSGGRKSLGLLAWFSSRPRRHHPQHARRPMDGLRTSSTRGESAAHIGLRAYEGKHISVHERRARHPPGQARRCRMPAVPGRTSTTYVLPGTDATSRAALSPLAHAQRLIDRGIPVVVCKANASWKPGDDQPELWHPAGSATITAEQRDLSSFRGGHRHTGHGGWPRHRRRRRHRRQGRRTAEPSATVPLLRLMCHTEQHTRGTLHSLLRTRHERQALIREDFAAQDQRWSRRRRRRRRARWW